MSKKILFVLHGMGTGGIERVMVTLANKLVGLGYDVTVLVWRPRFEFRDKLDSRVRFIYKAPDKHLGNRIPYIRYKFYDDCMWEIRANPSQYYRYYVGREKYDVEIAFMQSRALKIVSGSTNKKALHIAWIHTDFVNDPGFMSEFSTKEDFTAAYGKMDKIVCVSKQAEKGFRQTVGDWKNIYTIHSPIPVSEIEALAEKKPDMTINKAKLHLVSVGRFADYTKGQIRLMDAVIRLRKEGEDISLALLGQGQDEQLFRDHIKENDAGGFITVAGNQTNPYPFIKEADLLVCSSYFETYNLTVAEALILKTPVLSTKCGGPEEILGKGEYGILVENSEEGLYSGLKEICRSPGILEQYRKKAAQRRDTFDEDEAVRQITELWEEDQARIG